MKISRRTFELAALAAMGTGLRAAGQEPPPPAPTREVPWLGEVQVPPPQLPPDAPRLRSLLFDKQNNRITTVAQWQAERQEIHENWLQFIGSWAPPKLPPGPRRPLEHQIRESETIGNVTRRLITYETDRDMFTEAYLLMPREVRQPLPAVVVLHSTVEHTIRQGAGIEGRPEAAWGLQLAQRGFVVICPRCFLWDGVEEGNADRFVQKVQAHHLRHPNTRGMGKMLYDARRAVDLLVSLPEVDGRRIGAAGHSLGAKEALYLAAFDDRVRAAVASEGGISTRFSNWDAPWYLGTKDFGHDHHELLALIAPRAFLVIGGEAADGDKTWPFIASALEVYNLYGGPPRVGLLNHRQGHTIPPIAEARTYEWLQMYV